MPDLWTMAGIAVKWALYLGIFGASGTVFCALVFDQVRANGRAAAFAALGLGAAGLSFLLKGVALTGDASGLTDPEMLGLLWSTQSGTALLLQGSGLALLALGSGLGRIGRWVSAVGGVVAIWSLLVTGHIADRDDVLLSAVLLAHLVGIALWIGILSPLRRLTSQSDTLSQAAELGHAFGRLASVTVPALILAGLVMTYVLVGSVTAMWTTGYGRALLLKLVLVAVLLTLAALNKTRLVPALARGDTAAARHLARSITVEWIAVLGILAVTAALTSILTLPT